MTLYEFNEIPAAIKRDLKTFIKHCWFETYSVDLDPIRAQTLIQTLDDNGLDDLLPHTDERLLIKHLDGQIASSAIFAERGRTAYIWGFYVNPSLHRRGIGREMIEGIRAAINSAERVQVSVLFASPSAIAFYAAAGFVEAGREDIDIGTGQPEPAVIMSLAL